MMHEAIMENMHNFKDTLIDINLLISSFLLILFYINFKLNLHMIFKT